jgi:predicted DNA-binding protein
MYLSGEIMTKKKKTKRKRRTTPNAPGQGRRSMGLAPFFSARLTIEQDNRLNDEAKRRHLPKVYVLREWIELLDTFLASRALKVALDVHYERIDE